MPSCYNKSAQDIVSTSRQEVQSKTCCMNADMGNALHFHVRGKGTLGATAESAFGLCYSAGEETYTNGSFTETTKTLPASFSLGELR